MTTEQHLMHTALARSVPLPAEQPGSPYLEIHSVYAVHNRYLRLALAGSVCVILLLVAVGYKLAVGVLDRKPVVVRIDQNGQAAVAPYAILDYQAGEREIRYFLSQFVVDHYSRVKATAKQAFARKLFYLDPPLAKAVMEEETRTKEIANFLATGAEEGEVYVTNVAIEDMRQQPYKASVNFERVYQAAGDQRETRREKYLAHFQVRIAASVPNNIVQVNPLGLLIAYFRTDQAFQ